MNDSITVKYLNELVSISKGKKPRNISLENLGSGYLPYILIESFNRNYREFTNDKSCKRVVSDDIEIVWDGERAGLVSMGHDGYLGSTLAAISIISESLNSNFLFYFLQSKQTYLRYLAEGTGVPHISRWSIDNLEIPLLPIEKQKKIASILTSVDEVIDNTQKQIDKLQDLKKATTNELLTKGIGHTEFKDSELGRIPKRWEVYELGKLCNFTQGVQISLDETLRVKKDGYIRYLYINDFSSDKNLRFIKDEFPKKIVTEQDLIMANTGHSAGTVFRGKHGVLSNNAFKISIKKLIKSEYLFHYLSTDNYWFKIRKLFNSAGQPHVGHSNIAKLQFLCPSIDEQDKILSIFHKIDENILNNEKKLSKIKFLKNSLMQDLLTGKIRVKVN